MSFRDALLLAERFRDKLALRPGEDADDVLAGAVGVAMKRASLFGRAPVIHDLALGLTLWGFLDASAPDDLVATRRSFFEGASDIRHHETLRHLVDQVPEATLRMSRDEVRAAYPGQWQSLLGLQGS